MNDETKQGTEIAAAQDAKVVAVLTASSGGSVVAIGADGIARELQPGDPIFAGDTVEAVLGGQALVTLANGDLKELPRDGSFLFTADSVTQLASYGDGENASQFEELLAALERGEDISEKLEETAAGGDNAGGGGAGDEIGQGAIFGRSINEVRPQAGFDPNLDPRPIIDPTADTEIILNAGAPEPLDDNPNPEANENIVSDGEVKLNNGPVSTGGNILDNDEAGADGYGNPPITGVEYDGSIGPATKTVVGNVITFTADAGNWVLTINTQTGDYEFTLLSPYNHQGPQDLFADGHFTYTIQDSDGDTGSAVLTIRILDDVPVAVADTGSVNEGALLTVDAASGVLSNDTAGADGAAVVGVRAAGGDTTSAVSGGLNTDIVGAHGTLKLQADGSYTYKSDPNSITGNETDVFVYTIRDGDGDLSTITLTINLTDSGLIATNDDEVLVDEAALDTNALPDGDDLVVGTVTGSLPGGAGETDASNTLVGNASGGFGALTYALVSGGNAVTAGVYGSIQVNSDGTYTYTLSKAVTTNPAADNGAQTEQNVESFTYIVTDANGNTSTGIIYIDVKDDVPTASISATQSEGQEGLVDNTLTTDETSQIGVAVTSAAALVSYTADTGADGGTTDLSLVVTDADSGLFTTVGNKAITLVADGSDNNIVYGKFDDTGTLDGLAFTIVLNANGTVTVTQAVALKHPLNTDNNEPVDLTGKLSAKIQVTDGDGDVASDQVEIGSKIIFLDDGPSVSAGSASTDGIVLTTDDTEAKGGSDANAYGATANDSGALVAALLSAASGTAAYGADGQGAAATIGSFALNVVTADSGLTSGGSIIYLYNVAGVVVGSTTAPGDVTDDASITDNGVFTIAVSGAGVVTLTQTGAIDHLPNADASSYDELIALSDGKVTLSATVTVTDGDLDTASTPVSVDLGGNIKFADDGPSAAFTTKTVSVVHDETSGIDSGTNDVASIPAALVTAIAALTNGPAGAALGQATSGSALVADSSASVFGADGPAASNSLVMSLTNSAGGAFTGQDSGLDVTGGYSIFLYTENGLIVGREGSNDTTANPTGAVAFIVSLGSDGKITLVEYKAIEHPTPGTSHNESVSLTDLIYATVVATDGDGDTSTVTSDTALTVTFKDDGPTAPTLTINANGSVIHDETAGLQNATATPSPAGDADDKDVAGSTAITFNGASTTVAALFSALGGTPLGYAAGGAAIVSLTGGGFGTDGQAATGATTYALKVTNTTFSGVSTTGGTQIFLYDNGSGVILGRVGTEAGVTDTANPTGAIAFAITIDPLTGQVYMVQYQSLNHPLGGANNPDDSISLTDSALQVTVTYKDGDGDTATSAPINIGNRISFEDDGPTAPTLTINASGAVIHDETAGLQNATATPTPAGDADDKDVAGSTAITFNGASTTVAALFSALGGTPLGYAAGGAAIVSLSGGGFGADGQAASGATTYALQVTDTTFSGVSTTGGTQIFLYDNGSGVILGRVGTEAGATDTANSSGAIAFAITIDPVTGQVYVAQYLSLYHPLGGASNPDDSISLTDSALQVTVTYKDGDGDTATSAPVNIGSSISFEDDAPVINSIQNMAVANVAGLHSAAWSFLVGADGFNAVDDIGPDINSSEGINITLLNTVSLIATSSTEDLFDGSGNYLGEIYTAKLADGATFFTLTMKVDGTYDFNLVTPNPTQVITETLSLTGSIGGNSSSLYAEQIAAKKGTLDPKTDIKFTAHEGYVSDTNLGANSTVNTNNNGIGAGSSAGGLRVSNGESLTLKFLVGDADLLGTTNPPDTAVQPITSIKLTFDVDANSGPTAGNNTNTVRFILHFADGSSETTGNIEISNGQTYDVKSATAGKEFLSVDVVNVDPDGEKFFIVASETTATKTILPDDLLLSFGVEINDGDGDSTSGTFQISIDTNGNVTGTAGSDIFFSSAGNDVFNGGDGNDTVSYIDAGAGVTVSLANTSAQNTVGAGTDTLSNIENLTGSAHNDVLTGNSVANILTGGKGSDTMTGGLGADIFKWLAGDATGNPTDTITDFNKSSGVYNSAEGDVLDLAALLVGETGTASNLTNFLNFSESSGDTIIKIDVDGGGSFGTPDQTIVLQGVDLVTGAVDQTAIIQTLLTGNNLVTDVT